MKNTWVGPIVIAALLCLPIISAAPNTQTPTESTPSINLTPEVTPPSPQPAASITILKPVEGYAYFFNLKPLALRHLTNGALVVGRRLTIDTATQGIDHTKFIATRKLTGFNTTQWDYSTLDGTGTSLPVDTGIYTITAIGYDITDHEVANTAVKVFYLKIGREDFGVWANTKYDSGLTVSTPLNIGMTEFSSMLNSGVTKTYAIPIQHAQDTTLTLRFSRTTLLNNTVNVIETQCSLDTNADITKAYELSLEVRFPFDILSGGQIPQTNVSIFSASMGYRSTAGNTPGLNHVNTTFFFGRENLSDPRIFRLRLQPDSVDARSSVTYFTRYQTHDKYGVEQFYREFSVGFTPATDLTITMVPREAKVSYDFGRSAGVPTQIVFRAEGGALDDIIQTYRIDPLPQFMNFDLTLLGSREFLYESDRPYDASYALDSEQNGNLLTIEAKSIPTRIDTTWGIDFHALSNHSLNSFLDINMSSEIAGLIITQADLSTPLINISHFPRLFHIESAIDLDNHVGNITVLRKLDAPHNVTLTMAYDDFILSKSFILDNQFVVLAWDLDPANSTGQVSVTRDTASSLQYHTMVSYQGWTFANDLTLSNPSVSLSWAVDRENRMGRLVFTRDPEGGSPILSTSLSYDSWTLENTLELQNPQTELYWDLATSDNPHAVINLTTGGEALMTDTLAVVDNDQDLLRISLGLQTSDHLCLSWDNVGGQIQNFQWSGQILQLTSLSIAVDLPGDLLTIQGSWQMGAGGAVDLAINKPVLVTFADVQTPRFQVLGYVSFTANRELAVRWDFSNTGYLRVDTYGQPLGDDAAFKIFFDPDDQGDYKYGFNASTDNFMEANFNVSWDTQYTLPYIWVAGQLPINWWSNWDSAVMLNGVWYHRNGWNY
jgi:hypothetical protein